MRAVVQRVDEADVTVAGEVVGEIGTGLLMLVGVTRSDREEDAHVLADKVSGLRIFPDDAQAMNLSVQQVGGSVLVVSQFTLYGDAGKGRRPSFTQAAPPEMAQPLVEQVAERIRAWDIPVAEGRFGATMKVRLTNSGPVTITLESEEGRLV